MILVQLTAAAH